MNPGPRAALACLPRVMTITAGPRRAREWLADIAVNEHWCASDDEAAELGASWEDRFLTYFVAELSELRRVGRVSLSDLNSSSAYMIQGAAFVEPGEATDVREAKLRRGRLFDYASALARVSPTEFEAVCRGILTALNVEDVTLTPRSADEGIDFYGRLALDRFLVPEARLPTWEAQLKVWMIGQAKHHAIGQVSTPEIRELVGSVELAKSRAFSVGREDKYADLVIRACDPTVYLFFTTGTMSAYTWRLLDRSGVVGMDGFMVAAFLADRKIGVEGAEEEEFSATAFSDWIALYGHA